jgi:hypothetical protein
MSEQENKSNEGAGFQSITSTVRRLWVRATRSGRTHPVPQEERRAMSNDTLTLLEMCYICHAQGDWPRWPSVLDDDGAEMEHAFCPGCYEQWCEPFPEKRPDEEMDALHERVVLAYRGHLLKSKFRPAVCVTLERPDRSGCCGLCYEAVRPGPPWQFFWQLCGPCTGDDCNVCGCPISDVQTERRVLCPECAAICETKRA